MAPAFRQQFSRTLKELWRLRNFIDLYYGMITIPEEPMYHIACSCCAHGPGIWLCACWHYRRLIWICTIDQTTDLSSFAPSAGLGFFGAFARIFDMKLYYYSSIKYMGNWVIVCAHQQCLQGHHQKVFWAADCNNQSSHRMTEMWLDKKNQKI